MIDLVQPGPEDKLTIEQRGCLLRAARRQLLSIDDELTRYKGMDARHVQAVIEATEMERDCLDSAISWLWRQHLGP